MLLDGKETAQVQEAFRNIKNSMDVLVEKSEFQMSRSTLHVMLDA
jgi:hypothetical protein